MIIKSEERNRNKWKLGIVEDLIDEHLYPLKLSCDVSKSKAGTLTLDPSVQEFKATRERLLWLQGFGCKTSQRRKRIRAMAAGKNFE